MTILNINDILTSHDEWGNPIVIKIVNIFSIGDGTLTASYAKWYKKSFLGFYWYSRDTVYKMHLEHNNIYKRPVADILKLSNSYTGTDTFITENEQRELDAIADHTHTLKGI